MGTLPSSAPLQGGLGMEQDAGWFHGGEPGSAELLPWALKRLELPQDSPTTEGSCTYLDKLMLREAYLYGHPSFKVTGW